MFPVSKARHLNVHNCIKTCMYIYMYTYIQYKWLYAKNMSNWNYSTLDDLETIKNNFAPVFTCNVWYSPKRLSVHRVQR